MLYFNMQKENCTGCTACVAVCPVQCISMKEDEEGFVYPESDTNCIHCGKCERVCPIINENKWKKNENFSKEIAFCGISKSKKIWRESASGGAFSEICRAFGDDKTVIYGAIWDGYYVVHRGVIGVKAISPLRKSKYIESRLNDIFRYIKEDLDDGKKVIFCGSPCQGRGLKEFIGDMPDSLLVIDFICHGVGSPKVFRACLTVLEELIKDKIETYEFRTKRRVYETNYLVKVVGKKKRKGIYLTGDPYMQLFLKQECLRPSCGKNCRFRCEYRSGDITIADFKNLYEVYPELIGTKYNYSSIIVNSQKGEKIVESLQSNMYLFDCQIDEIKRNNPLFFKQTFFSNTRDEFFEVFADNPKSAIKKYTHFPDIMKLNPIKTMASFLPVAFRRYIIKQIRSKRHEKERGHD